MTKTPTPEPLSVWLLAAEADEADLSDVVARLAARLGTPRFHPHLTLAGDAVADPTATADALATGLRGMASVAVPVASIDVGPAYFRSFYARFPVTPDLAALRTRSHAACGIAESDPFLPHVSLAYGAADDPGREAARLDMARALEGRTIAFDRVAVVASSSNRPIDSWRILTVHQLGG